MLKPQDTLLFQIDFLRAPVPRAVWPTAATASDISEWMSISMISEMVLLVMKWWERQRGWTQQNESIADDIAAAGGTCLWFVEDALCLLCLLSHATFTVTGRQSDWICQAVCLLLLIRLSAKEVPASVFMWQCRWRSVCWPPLSAFRPSGRRCSVKSEKCV